LSKIVLTKKINAGFLAIVLIVGTLAAISPSFMIGAHAQQYGMDQQKYNNYEPDYGMNSYDDKQSYGKDNSYKSKDSSNVIVKKEKCNNINVNVNGFNGIEVGTLPTALNGLATDEAQAADEGEVGASSSGSGSGRPSGSDSDSRFVCIDNNDFAVTEGNGDETDPCGDALKACFEKFLSSSEKFAILTTALENGLDVEIEGKPLTLNSFADICSALEGLPFDHLRQAIIEIIVKANLGSLSFNLLTCIAQALDIPIPP
jgi:hypothetical protein